MEEKECELCGNKEGEQADEVHEIDIPSKMEPLLICDECLGFVKEYIKEKKA